MTATVLPRAGLRGHRGEPARAEHVRGGQQPWDWPWARLTGSATRAASAFPIRAIFGLRSIAGWTHLACTHWVTCSTNAIESLNAPYRRAVRARGYFPTERLRSSASVWPTLLFVVVRAREPARVAALTGSHMTGYRHMNRDADD